MTGGTVDFVSETREEDKRRERPVALTASRSDPREQKASSPVER